MVAIRTHVAHDDPNAKREPMMPAAIGITNVISPNATPLLRFRFKWNMSISSAARNMR